MVDFITHNINTKHFPIHCPGELCDKLLPDWEIRAALNNDEALVDRFIEFRLKLTVMQAKNLAFCPTPDCQFIYVKDDPFDLKQAAAADPCKNQGEEENKQHDPTRFKCPQCE
jgi:IBR domain, a half RING-finger domain